MASPASPVAHLSARRMAWLAMLVAVALLLRTAVPGALAPAAAASWPGADPVLAELLSGGGICHPDQGDPASPVQAACLLCPLCAGPAPMLLPGPPLPAARTVAALPARTLPPFATAPPAADYVLARPRAPPAPSA